MHAVPPRFIIFLLFLFVQLPCPVAQAKGKVPESRSVQINIGKLSQGIKLHEEKIRRTEEKEISVLDELAALDKKLIDQKDRIDQLQKRLQDQTRLLAEKDAELAEAIASRNRVLAHLQKRLRSFYQMGKIGVLNVTFSNRSLPELMLFTDAFERLISYDQAVIESYRQTVEQLKLARHAQELEQSVLQQFINQAEQEKKNLADLYADKEKLLSRLKMEKGLYEQALKEMRKAEEELGQTLARIKHKEDLKKQGFMLNKGKLPPPVKGRLIRKFGQIATSGFSKGTKSKGIVIETTGEAAVRAVYKGTVEFAGYKRGYGNMVIIDHGYQYFTIVSRLDTIVVNKGDKVKKGDLLGSTGDMATLFSKGLYFEVRYGSRAMDPLKWLRPGAYAKSRKRR
jgi:septal ring factor EnvC (AmiA/AmiB activator)